MHYSAVHVRARQTGEATVRVYGFAVHPGEPPSEVIEKWRAYQNDPRLGERYTHAQLVVDNMVKESYSDLPHPDEAAASQAALAAAEQARIVAANAAEAAQLRARLAELEPAAATEEAAAAAIPGEPAPAPDHQLSGKKKAPRP